MNQICLPVHKIINLYTVYITFDFSLRQLHDPKACPAMK